MIIFEQLKADAGIHFVGVNPEFQLKESARLRFAMDGAIACDAQPTLITTSSSGIPAFLSTYIDPKLIEVLVSPMKAAEIVGDESKKGDWTSNTAMFTMVESTGQTAAYGDYSESGSARANIQFPQRQAFHYQVTTQWGERELETAGLARVDWANRVSLASILTLNKFQNKTYFYGVSGLQNYGLLNDPALSATLTPITKAATGTSWSVATPNEVNADVQKMFKQLQVQCNGLVDRETPMTLALSPISDVYAANSSIYNQSAADILKKSFPNMKIITAPEYTTGSGELAQLIVDEYEAQRTATCAFTEKLRAHPIVVGMSNFKQKKSQGSWGCIIYRPLFIAQMLGI